MTRSKRKHSKAAGALVARAATATESPVSSGSSDSDLRPRNRACVDETQITLLALPGALGAATYAEAVQHLHGGASNHISASADTTDAIRALSAAVDDLRGLVQAQQIASLVDLVRLLLMSRVPGAPMHTPHAVPHAAHSAPRAAPAAKAAQPARPAAAAAPVASAAGAPAAERPAAAGAARAASARGPCRRGGLPARVGDASLRLSFVASISVEDTIVFVTGGDGCGHAYDVFSGCFADDAEEARRRAADAAAGVSMPVRLATNIVRFMHDSTGNWDGPAGGGIVSASFINAKPAVGGIGVEPRGGGVLRVLFTVASGAVADTVVRWRWKLRQTQVAVFDVLNKLGTVKHVVRLCSGHGADDPFYVDIYKVTMWASEGMEWAAGSEVKVDKVLGKDGAPFPDFIEAIVMGGCKKELKGDTCLLVKREKGILVSSDTVQCYGDKSCKGNKLSKLETSLLGKTVMAVVDLSGKIATLPMYMKIHSCNGKTSGMKADIEKLKAAEWDACIPPHGMPIKTDAKEDYLTSLEKLNFNK
ncbi:hypothetical protein FOA52_005146 [Chlamydomonas sp. UWO 241]|nr:hypothetical protein FOA52_005146 [Chlamydomonas sp. UWO 241]